MNLFESLTDGAIQNNWKTPTEFPKCPPKADNNDITEYANNLEKGCVFSKNQYGQNTVLEFEISQKDGCLYVITFNEGSMKPYGLAKISYENNLFVHGSEGLFFKEEGARKQFTLACGREWTGGDTFDEFC